MVIMGMHINETRSDYVTSGVDHFFGVGILQVADSVNAIGRDGDIPDKRFGIGTVDYLSTADQQVTSIRRAVNAH
jgi:hypothetical protein